MSWILEKGQFTKQYFINLPDGIEFYGWVFLRDNKKVTSGYRFKYPDGEKHFYTLGKDIDYKDLHKLEDGLAKASKAIADDARVELHTLEFPEGMTVEEQTQKMIEIGVAGSFTEEEWEEMSKQEEIKQEEIKKLDSLWGKGEEMTGENEVSSMAWLCDCIDKWMKANQENNKIVEFFGSFYIVNPEKDFNVEDERMFAFGVKETLLMTLKEMTKAIKKEKEDFVSW